MEKISDNKIKLLNSLRYQGFSSEIVKAFSRVKRENFIPEEFKHRAYDDLPLSIGEKQTISQPSTIATMLSMLELEKGQDVLEIGSGSGYVLALISEILGKNSKIYGIERINSLAERSTFNLRDYENIKVFNQNALNPLEEKILFDRILISSALKEVPHEITFQLKYQGIIVAPIGSPDFYQSITSFKKNNSGLSLIRQTPQYFVFVPFVEN